MDTYRKNIALQEERLSELVKNIPPGKTRVIQLDYLSYNCTLSGDYDNCDEALAFARKENEVPVATINAMPYVVYDDKGKRLKT